MCAILINKAMKINEVDLSRFADKNKIEQELRELYADVDLETLTNVANGAKRKVDDVSSELRRLKTANSPFSAQGKQDITALTNLMLNMYKQEMTVLFRLLREKKRGKKI